MHVAKADDRALGFRAGDFDAGRPVRLQHQSHRAGRHRVDQVVEQGFGGYALVAGERLFVLPELFLEPVDHPVAAKDLHFGAVGAGHSGRIGGNERRHLQVARAGGIDGGGGAVTQAADMRFQATGADHFASLVGGGSHQRRADRDAGVGGSGGIDGAQYGGRRDQFRQHSPGNRQRLPFPVAPPGPIQTLVIERHVADLRTGGIDILAAQAEIQIAGQHQEFIRGGPNFRLIGLDPVRLGFAAEKIDGAIDARQLECGLPHLADRRHTVGAPLIQPHNGRAQRLALLIEINHGGTLGGDGDALDRRAPRAVLHP